jgi:hypothetical protein
VGGESGANESHKLCIVRGACRIGAGRVTGRVGGVTSCAGSIMSRVGPDGTASGGGSGSVVGRGSISSRGGPGGISSKGSPGSVESGGGVTIVNGQHAGDTTGACDLTAAQGVTSMCNTAGTCGASPIAAMTSGNARQKQWSDSPDTLDCGFELLIDGSPSAGTNEVTVSTEVRETSALDTGGGRSLAITIGFSTGASRSKEDPT